MKLFFPDVGTHNHGGCGCGLKFLNPEATHTHIVGYPHPPWVTHTHRIVVSTLPDVEDDVKLEDGWDSID
jgi:hypothetical protein